LRLPGALADDNEAGSNKEVEEEEGERADESAWEDAEDDEEAKAAVDRVLKKYEKATVMDAEGTFDERHERLAKEKTDEWKRDYYRVGNTHRCG
jgi:5'-3' exoribonuclease 1